METVTVPVCSTCNDTHRMTLRDRDVMCTRCPTPCQGCRAGGTGAFCATTPCACRCHTARGQRRPGTAASPVTDDEIRALLRIFQREGNIDGVADCAAALGALGPDDGSARSRCAAAWNARQNETTR